WLKSEKTDNQAYSTALNILNNNPNLGIVKGQETLWGKAAADFLANNANAIGFGPHGEIILHQNSTNAKLTLEQFLDANIAGNIAFGILATRSECRNYLAGRKIGSKRAVALFTKMLSGLTFDSTLEVEHPANTDLIDRGIPKHVSLGRSFFNLSLMPLSVLDQVENAGVKVDGAVFAHAIDQRAF